jgi:hypothetical protein
MALADCGGEREYLPLVLSGKEENKGDDMALADCGGKSTKTYLLYVVEKKRTSQ